MPSSIVPARIAARSARHAVSRPARHGAHSPQDGAHEMTTGSPGGRRLDAGPDGLDDPRALVAEDHRRRPRPLAADHVQVAAAHADGGHAHEHLALARLGHLDLAQLERDAGRAEERGPRLHRFVNGREQRSYSLPPCLSLCGCAAAETRSPHAPSASWISPQVVTVETFWSAKLMEALCQSALIVEQAFSGTIM